MSARELRLPLLTSPSLFHNSDSDEIFDLADLTPQCGRRGDALKFFLSWKYYGENGLSDKVGRAFDLALKMQKMLSASKDIVLLSTVPPPCLQVSSRGLALRRL